MTLWFETQGVRTCVIHGTGFLYLLTDTENVSCLLC